MIEVFERRRWLLRLMGDALRRSVSSSEVVVSIGTRAAFEPDGHEPRGLGLQPPRAAIRGCQPDRPQAHGLRRRHHDGPLGRGGPDQLSGRQVLVGNQARLLRDSGRVQGSFGRGDQEILPSSPAPTTPTRTQATTKPKNASRSSPRPTRYSRTRKPDAPTIHTATRYHAAQERRLPRRGRPVRRLPGFEAFFGDRSFGGSLRYLHRAGPQSW